MNVAILFNAPTLPPAHPDYEQEAGVLVSVVAFRAALEQAGHRVTEAPLRSSIRELVERFETDRPDVVVNLCEGFGGRSAAEVYVAGLLELLGLPYTGCGPECLALVHDKARCKRLLLGAGVPTAPFLVVHEVAELAAIRFAPRSVGFSPRESPSDNASWGLKPTLLADSLEAWFARGPLFVKPATEDASLGIGVDSVVADFAALERQSSAIAARYGPAMIEPYIDGREFNVSVVELPDRQVLPLAEIEFRTSDAFRWPIVTYESKWATGSVADLSTTPRCPAKIEPMLAEMIRTVALAAFELTGCRDYARVDLRVNRDGEIFVLEVNANPDAAPEAGLARALAAANVTHEQFVVRLVERAFQRSPGAEGP